MLDMPLPVFDIAACAKTNTDLIQSSCVNVRLNQSVGNVDSSIIIYIKSFINIT